MNDLKERLEFEDNYTVIEKLGITSEQLVERFSDVIDEKFEELIQEYKEEYGDFQWEELEEIEEEPTEL